MGFLVSTSRRRVIYLELQGMMSPMNSKSPPPSPPLIRNKRSCQVTRLILHFICFMLLSLTLFSVLGMFHFLFERLPLRYHVIFTLHPYFYLDFNLKYISIHLNFYPIHLLYIQIFRILYITILFSSFINFVFLVPLFPFGF